MRSLAALLTVYSELPRVAYFWKEMTWNMIHDNVYDDVGIILSACNHWADVIFVTEKCR